MNLFYVFFDGIAKLTLVFCIRMVSTLLVLIESFIRPFWRVFLSLIVCMLIHFGSLHFGIEGFFNQPPPIEMFYFFQMIGFIGMIGYQFGQKHVKYKKLNGEVLKFSV